jgi:thioredoxin 1
MDEVASAHPQLRWRWLDIEDEAALMGDLDIETLPTVLVGRGDQVLFFGPVLPRVELLTRLLEALNQQENPAANLEDDVVALWRRLRQQPA